MLAAAHAKYASMNMPVDWHQDVPFPDKEKYASMISWFCIDEFRAAEEKTPELALRSCCWFL